MVLEIRVEKTFLDYKGKENLPGDGKALDHLIRYSVWQLDKNPEQAMRILMDVQPKSSANYLVAALVGNSPEHAMRILCEYGLTVVTINPLVGALGDKRSKDLAKQLILEYTKNNDLSDTILKPLAAALGNERGGEVSKELFSKFINDYGLTSLIANRLVGALVRDKSREPAKELLLEYIDKFGINKIIINPLVATHANPDSKGSVGEIIEWCVEKYGIHPIIINALKGGLMGENSQESYVNLFIKLGPSEETVIPLVRLLADPKYRELVERIFLSYGRKCLKYIQIPYETSIFYRPIKGFITKIKEHKN